jgi:hypothetical protein
MLDDASRIVDVLPPWESGKAVLAESGELYRGASENLANDLSLQQIVFHQGHIRGVWPTLKPAN